MITNLSDTYNNVCAAPGGNGFRVEHMPQLFVGSEIDDNEPHVHSFYEILWFQQGAGHHTVDFVEYKIKPNTIFFLSPGQIHNFDPSVDKHSYRGVAIKMCTDFLRDEECGCGTILKYNAFHTFDTAPYIYIDDVAAEELNSLVCMMEDEAGRKGQFGNIDVLKSLLRIFLVKIQRYGIQEGGVQLDNRRASHILFVQFRQLVEKEFRTVHTVQEYADSLNVALRTLGKSVTECSGKSPLAFINDRIVLEAKRLVRHSNMRIKEIAFELGFEDPSYFVKLFKRQTGHLPSDFRELDKVDREFVAPAYSKTFSDTIKDTDMIKIAIPTRDDRVDDHFGHCDHYTVFTVNDKREVLSSQRLESPQGCGCKSNIATVMQEMGITVMLAGNMGMGAFNKLAQHGISTIRGCKGAVEDVLAAYLRDEIQDSSIACDHHDCGNHASGNHLIGNNASGRHEDGHHDCGHHENGHYEGETYSITQRTDIP